MNTPKPAAASGSPLPEPANIAWVRPFRSRRGAAGQPAASTGSVAPPVDEVRTADRTGEALVRAGRGDENAFAEFYDEVSALVYGIVLKVLRNPAQAEEVSQEVFVEIWRLAPRFDRSRGSARSWASTMAHRRAVDRVRSEQAARDREERDSHRPPAPPEGVADEIITRLEHQRVRSGLEQLTDTQREAVTLAYYGGHTYREVASLLGIPEGTVKTRIRDGLIKLRDFMEVRQ